MSNPFYKNRADEYTSEEVLRFYCHTPTLNVVANPRNQVIYGGPGTGKSVLLKRLASATLVPQDDGGLPSYFGIYIDARRQLQVADSVFHFANDEGVIKAIPDAPMRALAFVKHFTCLCLILRFVEECILVRQRQTWADQAIRNLTKYMYSESSASQDSLPDEIAAERREMELSIANQSMLSDEAISQCRFKDILAIARILAEVTQHSSRSETRSLTVYFLIDQYDSLSDLFQTLLNPLLRLGSGFITKVAVRPYGLGSVDCHSGPALSPNDDFHGVFVEYSRDNESDYTALVDSITAKMLGSKGGVSSLIRGNTGEGQYGSFETLCKLSSGSIRTFLDTIALAVDSAHERNEDWRSNGLRGEDFNSATANVARYHLERISAVRKVPGEAVKSLIRGLCSHVRKSQGHDPDIKVDSGKLFDGYTQELERILKRAFELGALRFIHESDASLVLVPPKFSISRVFFPYWSMPVR